MIARASVTALWLLLSVGLQAETLRVTDLDIDKLRVQGSVEVQVSQGEESELLVRGDSDDLEKRPFYINNSTLILGHSRAHQRENFSSVKYMLTVPVLSEIRLSGSGDVFVKPMAVREMLISVEGSGDVRVFALSAGETVRISVAGSGDIKVAQLHTPVLDLMVSGSGDIAIGELLAEVVEATISGSGDISAESTAERAATIEINIIGGGEVDLTPLAADVAEVNIIGSGDARVGEIDSLEVNIVGSGDIYYAGEPELDSNVLGSGDLNRQR